MKFRLLWVTVECVHEKLERFISTICLGMIYFNDNLQVHDFVTMTTEQRTELKVRLLLERFKVIIKSQVWCVHTCYDLQEMGLCAYVSKSSEFCINCYH